MKSIVAERKLHTLDNANIPEPNMSTCPQPGHMPTLGAHYELSPRSGAHNGPPLPVHQGCAQYERSPGSGTPARNGQSRSTEAPLGFRLPCLPTQFHNYWLLSKTTSEIQIPFSPTNFPKKILNLCKFIPRSTPLARPSYQS